ncbi:MAG: aminoacyl-tRNA hydrolase [Patescibacteria group bacterium]|nr:aminoacyl-tRNA hydrolase [Patescibacteria group bacterium]
MKLIAGLGNPGRKYEKTRHNLGFMVLDVFADKINKNFKESPKFKGLIIQTKKFILLKPMGFMNNSGFSVAKAAGYFKIKESDILVVHDDIDLPVASLRISLSRGSAGHKGVESVIDQLGSKDFVRLRMGIGRPDDDSLVEDYVLEKINLSEKDLKRFLKKAEEAIEKILK